MLLFLQQLMGEPCQQADLQAVMMTCMLMDLQDVRQHDLNSAAHPLDFLCNANCVRAY